MPIGSARARADPKRESLSGFGLTIPPRISAREYTYSLSVGVCGGRVFWSHSGYTAPRVGPGQPARSCGEQAWRLSHEGACSGQNGSMGTIDHRWAIEEIDRFLHVTARINPNRSGSGIYYLGTVMRGPQTEASERAHVMEQILDRALPGWKHGRPEHDKEYRWLRDKASRCRAALERAEELAAKLGENAPDMDASNLHPWAWENGKRFWSGGHYHQAVMQAAILINSETQLKLGRADISETDLFNQAFTIDEPKPGAPRLRLMANDGSRTYENLHRGARAFADGLYTAIRNPGMHTPHSGGEEQLALEQLAAFSLLARWVEQADVIRV